MITANDIESALNLTGVCLSESSGVVTITADQEVTDLIQAQVQRMWDVGGMRSIYPRELLGRLTMAEVVAAIRSDAESVIFAVANLQTTVSPVLLDSEETRMLIGSLVMAGILTPERMAEVLA
jgi:hypothetical protein